MMSKDHTTFDMDDLSDDEREYLRARPWLPQHPDDVEGPRPGNDWDEDTIEVVPVDGVLPDDDDDDGLTANVKDVDDNGDPIVTDEDGNTQFDWEAMTVSRLKEFCTEYELPTSGPKRDLVARLREYDELTED